MIGSKREIRDEVAALRQEIAHLTAEVRILQGLTGPMGIPLPDGSMLVQTTFGTKYCIDPMDMVIAPNLMVYRQWEPELSRLMRDAATKDTVFIDIGAAFGYFTCIMGSAIGQQGAGKVISVEPNPAMLKLLRRNCTINWSMSPIDVHGCAVANALGVAEFSVPANRAANAALVSPASRDSPGNAGNETIEVQLKRLDDIVPPGQAVDIVKIDVEGHEWAALAGAERTISESPGLSIVMEWSLGQMQMAGYSVEAMVSLFERLRLDACAVPADLVLAHAGARRLSAAELAETAYDNIVLVRRPA